MNGEDKVVINFRANLKRARTARGLSRSGLGALCGLTSRAITYYEEGKRIPNIDNAHKLAKALGLTLDDLLKEEG